MHYSDLDIIRTRFPHTMAEQYEEKEFLYIAQSAAYETI
jgi:hypothetical protein